MAPPNYLPLGSIYVVSTPASYNQPGNHLVIAVVQGSSQVEREDKKYLLLEMTLNRNYPMMEQITGRPMTRVIHERPITETRRELSSIIQVLDPADYELAVHAITIPELTQGREESVKFSKGGPFCIQHLIRNLYKSN